MTDEERKAAEEAERAKAEAEEAARRSEAAAELAREKARQEAARREADATPARMTDLAELTAWADERLRKLEERGTPAPAAAAVPDGPEPSRGGRGVLVLVLLAVLGVALYLGTRSDTP